MGYYERKGTEPLTIAVKQGSETAFNEFPGLKREDLDAVNDFYPHYLFYETCGKGRKIWSSCCHEKGRYISATTERTIDNRVRDVLWGRHGLELSCPFCGKPAELKAKGTARSCTSLEEYIPVVFLSTADNGETIYAQAYWTKKDYDRNWAAEPLYHPTYVYRFRRGEAVQWENGGYGDWNKQVNGFLKEPFRSGGWLFDRYCDYRVIGLECLKNSFLKYIDFSWCKNQHGEGFFNLARFLGLAAQYPENVEMLQKAGMPEVIDDWVRREVKNARNIRWGEKDPRKAFQLNAGELKAFLATRRELAVMTLYKQAKRQKAALTMAQCQEIRDALGWSVEKELPKITKDYRTTTKELFRYLKKQTAAGNALGTAFRAWKDYMTAAEGLGLRVYRDDVKFPKDVWAAHEDAAAKNRIRLQKLEEKAQKEKKRLARLAAEERQKALALRYGYEADGLIIRVPGSREEIIAEGKALEHCVGGYADRHMRGDVTILFMRKASASDKPFLTVEMNGTNLVQIHGFKNEGIHSAKGRFAPDPREVFRGFLDPWLEWVKKGSRRDKNGQPRLPKKKEVNAA